MAYLGLNSKSPTILFPSDFTSAKKGIPINGLIWMGSKNFMLAQITEKLSAGYKCLKLKIGAIDFSSEIEIIKSIRTKFTPDQLEIRVDANGAFDPGNAQKKLEILAKFNLHSIEQPIKQGQIGEMQKLCKNTPLPIALDEELIGIYDYAEKKNLLKTINPQYIILKPTLTGGFKASEEWIDLAKKQNITWWVTSALESNIGLNAIAQWTAKLGTSNYQGLGTGSLYTNNISSPLFVENGYIQHDSNNIWKLGKIIKDITF
jgi:L-alanine-DL-glutamate epimerase-like enolase superfamily enzyme